jgi:hypothetical protein
MVMFKKVKKQKSRNSTNELESYSIILIVVYSYNGFHFELIPVYLLLLALMILDKNNYLWGGVARDPNQDWSVKNLYTNGVASND